MLRIRFRVFNCKKDCRGMVFAMCGTPSLGCCVFSGGAQLWVPGPGASCPSLLLWEATAGIAEPEGTQPAKSLLLLKGNVK